MTNNRTTLAAIVKYLQDVSCNDRTLSPDTREAVEVAIEILERAYNITDTDITRAGPLHVCNTNTCEPSHRKTTSQEDKERAEFLKHSGNEHMKREEFAAALEKYSQAIELDSQNAVYFCNRAAAFTKLNNHLRAIDDCKTAISLNPSYAKAHARMGAAYVYLEKYREARDCYKKASELEHNNETYRDNLRLCEERLGNGHQSSESSNVLDLSGFFTDQNVLNFVNNFMADPNALQLAARMTEVLPGLFNNIFVQTNQSSDSSGHSSEQSRNAN